MRWAARQGGGRLARLALGLGAMACGAGLLAAGLTGDGRRVTTDDEEAGRTARVLGEVIERSTTTTTTTTTGALDGSAPSAVPAPVPGVPDTTTSTTVAGADGPAATTSTTRRRQPTTTSTAPVGPSTTTTLACTDCGSLWTRSPGPNQPLQLTVTVSASTLQEGEDLVITVEAGDPDAMVRAPFVCVSSADGAYRIGFHPGAPSGDTCLLPHRCVEQRPGPIDPPAPTGSSGRWTMRLVPPDPGTYTVTVDIDSTTMPCQPDPYASAAHHTTTVTVV